METAVTAGAWIMAAVLGWAGQAKVRRPGGTSAALRLTGLPSATWIVRVLGAVELAVAGVVLVAGGRVPALLLSLAYAAFSVYAVVARRRPTPSCGCFGDETAPLTSVHVAVDGIGAVTAAAAVVVAAPGMPAALTGVTFLLAAAGVGVAAGLVTLLLTALPALTAALVTDGRTQTAGRVRA